MTAVTVMKNRVGIILTIISIFALLIPSQFRKGGIDGILMYSIPIVLLIIAYLYILPINTIPLAEKVLIPVIMWPVIYFIMTSLTQRILDRTFEDYEIAIWKTKAAEVFVNLLYYFSLTIPLIAIIEIYRLIRVRTE